MLHEQNGVLGRVNQLFAKRVDLIACGTWPTTLPDGVQSEYIGNPVRAAILERAGSGYIAPGDYPMSILVMGGSQGARILSDIVPPAIANLPSPMRGFVRVSHQAREEDLERVSAFYSEHGIDADVQTFFNDVPKHMSEAQLVISRAGASSVADISVIGRPSILIPLAFAIRDEQTANARSLVEAQAAVLIPESNLTPDTLGDQIQSIFENPNGANLMANAALSCGKPDAASDLATLVETLAESGKTK